MLLMRSWRRGSSQIKWRSKYRWGRGNGWHFTARFNSAKWGFFFAFFNTDSITKYKWRHAKFVQVLPTFSQEFLGTFFSWQLRNLPVLSAQLNPFQEPYVNKTELETKHKMDHQRKTWIRNDDLLKCVFCFFKLRFNFSFGSPWLKMEMTDTATYLQIPFIPISLQIRTGTMSREFISYQSWAI